MRIPNPCPKSSYHDITWTVHAMRRESCDAAYVLVWAYINVCVCPCCHPPPQKQVGPISSLMPQLLSPDGGRLLLADPPNRTVSGAAPGCARVWVWVGVGGVVCVWGVWGCCRHGDGRLREPVRSSVRAVRTSRHTCKPPHANSYPSHTRASHPFPLHVLNTHTHTHTHTHTFSLKRFPSNTLPL